MRKRTKEERGRTFAAMLRVEDIDSALEHRLPLDIDVEERAGGLGQAGGDGERLLLHLSQRRERLRQPFHQLGLQSTLGKLALQARVHGVRREQKQGAPTRRRTGRSGAGGE